MKRTAAALAAAAVLLAGCSGDPDAKPDGKPGDPLSGLKGGELCATVDRATVEKQFHEQVRDSQSGDQPADGRAAVTCIFVTASMAKAKPKDKKKPQFVAIGVRVADEKAASAKEALDAYFVGPDGKPVEYQPIDGLGEAAGYGSSQREARVAGGHLVVILKSGDAFVEVVAKSEPQGALEQLRPIADELVEGVQAELG